VIEDNINAPLQARHMEASLLLAEAVDLATELGFSICVNGGTADVFPWQGKPLIREVRGDALFEAQYLDNLIDWLEGVAFGRTNVGVGGQVP